MTPAHWLGIFALTLTAARAYAMDPVMHAGELAHALDRLSTTARVLYVAAHPDDENTRLLAYFANQRHLVVGYLSMTRGGGGQNLIGDEQGELLDVIRTEELLAARRLDGAVQRFTRMHDFGYSKSADETLSLWGRDEALADVVWVFRTFQPDVVITRFDEKPPNHGHHTASAILAREAFAAAGDPTRFPEQLRDGVVPWKPTRLLHNVSPVREGPPPAEAFVLDVGGYDVRLGLGYGELAALSRSQHKSQGFGVPGERGPLLERFLPVVGSRPEKDLLDGVPLGWERYGEPGRAFGRAVAEAASALDRDRPERALPALARAHHALEALKDEPRVVDAQAMLARVLAGVSGLFLRATAKRPAVVPGAEIELQLEAVARRPADVVLQRVVFPGGGREEVSAKLGVNEKRLVSRNVVLPADAAVSVPYWLIEQPEPGRYRVADPKLVGEPRGPSPLSVGVEVAIGGRELRFDVPVVYAWTDRVHGERTRPVLVVPPATVTPLREAVLSANGRPAAALVRVRAGGDGVEGEVTLGVPRGWKSSPAVQPVKLARAGDEVTLRFDVVAEPQAPAAEVRPAIRVGERSWSFREDVIDYPHIPMQVVLQPASLRLVPIRVSLPKGLVGYVPGSGDTIAEDLQHIGVKVETLDEAALRGGDLGRYAAIVLGIRAYNTRPVLRAVHDRLMRYVEQGGKLVVQYNTTSRWSPLEGPIGPFPLQLGNGRITDETAALTPVDPKHPLLQSPNAITPADFEGWVQERGIYFASTWDERYQPLFRIADPKEAPLEGSTLVAKHGKGRYVYTGLSFFRQLRAGVPGAYRLFVNFIGGS